MKTLRPALTLVTLAIWLITTACGGSEPTPAPAPPANVQPTSAPAATNASAPTSAPTTAPAAAAATATVDPTRKTLDLSRTNQPGSTLSGTPVEQIVFGEGYDEQKNLILGPAFTFPVAIPKVLFGFGVVNGDQALTFTETLKFNGEVVPLPVAKFAVPPARVGQKQLRVKGLAVKPGAQFPIGRYQIEVYVEGQLVQQGIFDVLQPKSAGLWFGASPALLLTSWSGARPAQLDPDLFVVTEEEIAYIEEEVDYYTAEELQAAYSELELIDDLYEPFPDEVLEAIEAEALEERAALCAEAGGFLDEATGECVVEGDDLEQACAITGGAYDPVTGACSYGEADSDNDGWADGLDNCPFDANPDQGDADNNGSGDVCDSGEAEEELVATEEPTETPTEAPAPTEEPPTPTP